MESVIFWYGIIIIRIIREVDWTLMCVNTLIRLRGLRESKSKNGNSRKESLIFGYGIIIKMIRDSDWKAIWVNILSGLNW